MSGHTQGPWRFEFEDGYCGEIIASNGKVLCAFVEEPSEEDARLMTSAPELLEALKDAHSHIADDALRTRIGTLIVKAEGFA